MISNFCKEIEEMILTDSESEEFKGFIKTLLYKIPLRENTDLQMQDNKINKSTNTNQICR